MRNVCVNYTHAAPAAAVVRALGGLFWCKHTNHNFKEANVLHAHAGYTNETMCFPKDMREKKSYYWYVQAAATATIRFT